MAKLIIPESPGDDIHVYGLGRLDIVDMEIIGEILERTEPLLRTKPRVSSLIDAAILCMSSSEHHSDGAMLYTLAIESGEPPNLKQRTSVQ